MAQDVIEVFCARCKRPTTVMSIVALIFVPIVLAYQGWTYWIFRQRIGRAADHLEY